MVLQRWFNSSVVGSKSLGCLQVGVRKTSPVGLDQKLVIVCKMASKKKYEEHMSLKKEVKKIESNNFNLLFTSE